MNKMTKEIKIINVLNEEITVKSISYELALKLAKIRYEQHFLLKEIMDKLFKATQINNEELKNEAFKLHDKYKDIEIYIDELRTKNNYWYCGIDNLDKED
ncbi:hypothetical protein FDF26_15400 [Clostridium botulinum]|nr:hypothetical protein [Clostridium botulinum]